jgi:hypothetical protein
MVCRYGVQVKVVMCSFVIWDIYIAPKDVNIACVGARVTIFPEITMIGGVVLYLTDHILG